MNEAMATGIPSWYLTVPFFLQSLTMGADEFIFHRRRIMPRWERIGHPLDTLTVIACYAWTLLTPPGPFAVWIFVAMSCLSCLFVTKDEPVHRIHCGPAEQWLHAILFVLHPVALISMGLFWPAVYGMDIPFIQYQGFEKSFLFGGLFLTSAFALYQTLYWNLSWKTQNSK